MILMDYLFKLFSRENKRNVLLTQYNIQQDNYSNYYFNTGFFKDNSSLVSVYKKFLLTLGRCPKCNGFLFLELKEKCVDEGYSAFSVCTNHCCGYEVDVSRGFNEALGIKSNFNCKDDVTYEAKKLLVGFNDKSEFNQRLLNSQNNRLKSKSSNFNPYDFPIAEQEVHHKVYQKINGTVRCPVCGNLGCFEEFTIQSVPFPRFYNVEVKCNCCNSFIDVSDFFIFYYSMYSKDKLGVGLSVRVGLERLSDCNVKLVSVPRVTGFLDCSFRDALGRKCGDFEGFVEK